MEIDTPFQGTVRGVVDLVLAEQFAVDLDAEHWSYARSPLGEIPINTRYICRFDAPWRPL